MALLDKNLEIEYPYNIHIVYGIVKNIAKSLEGMTLEKLDNQRFSVQLKCEASSWSWGETVTITCSYIDDSHTFVFIKSEPKVKFAVVDFGKGKRNIQQIVDALNSELPVNPTNERKM